MSIIHYINQKLILPFADRAMGTEILKYVDTIKKMSTWTTDEIKNWQNKRLKELITHAYQNTAYYKELFDQHSINPSDITNDTDLLKIPILTKEDILNSPEKFIPKNISDIKYKHSATGGSSGDPLQYLIDLRSFNYITAMRYYHLDRAGYRSGDKMLVIGSGNIVPGKNNSLKYKLFYLLNGRYNVDAVNLSDEIADRYLKLISKKKIMYVYGYAAPIYLLACRAKKRNIKTLTIKVCITTAEMLHDEYREMIESVFNCKVIDAYGAGDGGISAYESDRNIYQVGYNSVIETEKSSVEDTSGNILITDLLNFATPFIRYRIGDRVSIADPEIAKKYYNGQIINRVWGRSSDYMRLENGYILTGPAFTVFFQLIHVKAYRIKKIGPMHIECELVKTDKYEQSEEDLIISTFKEHAGQDCKVTITYVDKFKPLPSGKRDYFLSD